MVFLNAVKKRNPVMRELNSTNNWSKIKKQELWHYNYRKNVLCDKK